MDEHVLERIEQLLQALVKMQAAALQRDAFSSAAERLAYEMTGESTQTEICKAAKISATTLSDLWARLEKIGLLKREGNRYRKVVQDQNG